MCSAPAMKEDLAVTALEDDPKVYTLVPAADTAPPLWGVREGSGSLMIDTPSGRSPFPFRAPVQAGRFAMWLRESGASSVGGKRLWTIRDGRVVPQTAAGSAALQVELVSLAAADAPTASSARTIPPYPNTASRASGS
jgi:hypothetical protein